MDLSGSYRSLVRRFFPNACIVADRFHVVRVVQHFMRLARLLAANLKNHCGNLAALRTAPERLTSISNPNLKTSSKLQQNGLIPNLWCRPQSLA